eukprot:TRINITY_DN15843_c0_g1_i1.p1 TRINITY_DN15843_c0_g1~~TRINITY_DN15843_c0_g1_i1.p1  ORF type:complete len:569 (+),score=162.47 TRINITY_DN15843_c0_g1_i1:36-1742(+)
MLKSLFANFLLDPLRLRLPAEERCWANESSTLQAAEAVAAPPFDVKVSCAGGFDLDGLLYGGVAVAKLPEGPSPPAWLVNLMREIARRPLHSSVMARSLKAVAVGREWAVGLRAGLLDDNDHMTLGDYGSEYGEYRWGLFSRALHRMIGQPWHLRARFEDWLPIFEVPIQRLSLSLFFPTLSLDSAAADSAGGVSIVARGGGAEKKKKSPERLRFGSWRDFAAALAADLAFGLEVPSDRLAVQPLVVPSGAQPGSGHWIEVVVAPARSRDNFQDYPLHAKKRPWTTWHSYYGKDMDEHPLAVVAQTFREKMLMVGEDLSDLYSGKATVAAAEGQYEVKIASKECKRYARTITLNKFKCVDAAAGAAVAAAAGEESDGLEAHAPPSSFRHSILYGLAAKEKLDGLVGVGAEASLKTMYKKLAKKPWPPLVQASPQSRELRHFEGKLLKDQSCAPKGQCADVLEDSWNRGCSLKTRVVAWRKMLRPGGLAIVEGLQACFGLGGEAAFANALRELYEEVQSQRLEYFVVGRNVLFAMQPGTWSEAEEEPAPMKKKRRRQQRRQRRSSRREL